MATKSSSSSSSPSSRVMYTSPTWKVGNSNASFALFEGDTEGEPIGEGVDERGVNINVEFPDEPEPEPELEVEEDSDLFPISEDEFRSKRTRPDLGYTTTTLITNSPTFNSWCARAIPHARRRLIYSKIRDLPIERKV